MALSLGQLNRAGLGATKFGSEKKTSGTSAQATRNLANSSAATRVSHFDFKSSKRTNFVAGQNNNINLNKYDYSRLRGSLGNGRSYQQIMGPSVGYMQNVPNMNNFQTVSYDNTSFQKGLFVAQTVFEGVELLNNIGAFDGLKSSGGSSLGSKLSSAFSSLGGGGGAAASAAANSAISAMTGQTTSDGLRQAISSAEEKLSSYDANEKLQNYESNVTKLEGEISELKADVKAGEKDVDAKSNDVTKANNTVEITTTKRDVAKQGLETALKTNQKCTTAYAEAKSNLASAEQKALDTPKTITVIDANGTPKEVKNEPAYSNAQSALTAAKKAEAQAKEQLQMSKEEVDAMNKSVADAETKLKEAEEKLTNAETELTKAKETHKIAKEKLEEDKKDLLDKQKELQDLKEAKQDQDALRAEIGEQKTRLAELEQEERERASELTSDISDKVGKVSNRKIDASNGMNIAERYRQNRNEKDNAKIESMSDELDALRDRNAKTDLLADNTNVIMGSDGQELRSGQLPSGKTVYFIGTKEVSQTEFEAAKPATS